MKIGQTFQGVVTGIQSYGAFVELENGIVGLIHISEIKTGFIENIRELVHIGDSVQVQVVDVDEYTGKASLSMRSLEENKHSMPRRHRFTNAKHKIGFASLAQQMPTWVQESKSYLEKRKKEQNL